MESLEVMIRDGDIEQGHIPEQAARCVHVVAAWRWSTIRMTLQLVKWTAAMELTAW